MIGYCLSAGTVIERPSVHWPLRERSQRRLFQATPLYTNETATLPMGSLRDSTSASA